MKKRSSIINQLNTKIMENVDLVLIITIILGVYEVLARSIPKLGNYAPLQWIIKFLYWLSENLTRKKK